MNFKENSQVEIINGDLSILGKLGTVKGYDVDGKAIVKINEIEYHINDSDLEKAILGRKNFYDYVMKYLDEPSDKGIFAKEIQNNLFLKSYENEVMIDILNNNRLLFYYLDKEYENNKVYFDVKNEYLNYFKNGREEV